MPLNSSQILWFNTVSLSYSFCNKIAQTGWLKTMEMCSVTVLRSLLLLLSVGLHCTPLWSSEPSNGTALVFTAHPILAGLPHHLMWGRGLPLFLPRVQWFFMDNHYWFVVCCWSIDRVLKLLFLILLSSVVLEERICWAPSWVCHTRCQNLFK